MPLPQTDIVKEEGYYQPPNDSARWEPTCTVAGEFQRQFRNKEVEDPEMKYMRNKMICNKVGETLD